MIRNHYEFEASDRYMAEKFLNVLESFNLHYEDLYISKMDLDFCQISFRTTRNKRIQIEYVFRRLVGLYPMYLMDIDRIESSIELTGDDGYVIL